MGKLADIAVVGIQTINNVPFKDPMENLVRSASRNGVTQVIVNRELVVEDGVFLTVDEERFVEDVQRTP